MTVIHLPDIDLRSAEPDPTAPLTFDDIDAIVRELDPIRRNLLVTVGYHRLSHQLARVLGYRDANWCTFAVWASRHAGSIVRQQFEGALGSLLEATRLPKARLVGLLEDESHGRLGLRGFAAVVTDSFSQATSHGNTRVFQEVARFVVGFLSSYRDDGAFLARSDRGSRREPRVTAARHR